MTGRTMIGLLTVTGIRPGEAYRLNRTTSIWTPPTLVIADTKFGKTRPLPLHPSTVDAMRAYAQARDQASARLGDGSL